MYVWMHEWRLHVKYASILLLVFDLQFVLRVVEVVNLYRITDIFIYAYSYINP
jgi:hypothetical protein